MSFIDAHDFPAGLVLRVLEIEPPSSGQLGRLVNSAVRGFEQRFCTVTEERLDAVPGVVARLEELVELGEHDVDTAAGGGQQFLYEPSPIPARWAPRRFGTRSPSSSAPAGWACGRVCSRAGPTS